MKDSLYMAWLINKKHTCFQTKITQPFKQNPINFHIVIICMFTTNYKSTGAELSLK